MTALLEGLPFAKMSGSGNDFVFFDGRIVSASLVTSPEVIAAICNRHTGIGADGVVVLEPASGEADVLIKYFNSDGSAADLCGNATLCSTRLSVELEMATPGAVSLMTPAGMIVGRLRDGIPEIDFQPVSRVDPAAKIELGPGERRIGFALAGVPHLVVLCDDADQVNLVERGRVLRHHPAVGAAGANVNWVSPRPQGGWRYRTFERGVEGETLACGTGAVATAVLLTAWSESTGPVLIRTSSGLDVEVRFRAREDAPETAGTAGSSVNPAHSDTVYLPSLRGEGRVVFRGRLGTLRL